MTGSIPCPSPFILTDPKCSNELSDRTSAENLARETINPAYVAWKRTDKLLVTWLLASISENMFSTVSKCQFSTEVWFTLENEFLIDSKARALHLKSLLQSTQKGNLSVSEFVKKMKNIAENLSTSGQVITDEELLQYVLDGLRPEFDAVVVNLTSRIESKFDSITL